MELSGYKACICEGSAENAIMDTLLDNNLLVFSREEMIEEEIIRCRKGKEFEEKYLRKGFLVAAIKKYHEMSKIQKGEYTLLDLLK